MRAAAFLLAFAVGASIAAASPATDAQQIRKVADEFSAAWNRHDIKALAELFAEDADFVLATGKHLKGRAEVFKYHDEQHKTKLKDRRLAARFEDVRFLRSNIAIGHIAFEGSAASGDERRKTTSFATAVLLRRDGRWLITAFHNTLRSGSVGGVLPSDPK